MTGVSDPRGRLLCTMIRRFEIFWGSENLTHILTTIPSTGPVDVISCNDLLGCGSFVRGRKRKKGDSIPFILSRRDYMSRLPDECPKRASTTSDKLSSIPIYIYQTPFVHDSPATRTQSSSEDLVSQTAPLLGTRCYLRNSSGIAR